MIIEDQWQNFAADKKDIPPDSVRKIIFASWNRSRLLNVDPFFHGVVMISDEELKKRKEKKKQMLIAAMPHLHKLYRIIRNSKITITLTDEEGIILESFSNDKLKKMKNFPIPGSIHSENTIGTSGVGTALATGKSVQIIGAEHWLHDNRDWLCNTVPISRHNNIEGVLNLSCAVNAGHAHSLAMVTAAAYAIEREMEMNKILKERKNLVSQQKTIIELLDTGIIVVNEKCLIIQNNEKAQQILSNAGDWTGKKLKEIIHCNHNFNETFSKKQKLENFEISVKINNKHSYIGFSTGFIETSERTEGMVLRLREPAAIRHFAALAGGSNAIYNFDDIIGSSSELNEMLKLAKLASRNSTNVLITGESGTGKELIAQSIHNSSSRKNMPFVALNCGALSRELIQSELFGYEGGSFTGAKKNGNPGKFELADGGTLFLDEIGEMPLDAQINLLRVLQTGDVLRIGARHSNRVDVRVIAATNKDLEEEIKFKNFRNDLFYRLNVLQISLPSLKDRKSDIILLAEHFLRRFVGEAHSNITGFTPDVIDIFSSYSWPGNIRELENTIQRAVVICESDIISSENLPANINSVSESMSTSTATSTRIIHGREQVELNYIIELLARHKGNLRSASAEMGVARSTLYNKLKKFNLSIENYR